MNVPSIGEGADFRVENSIQAVKPLFYLYCVRRCFFNFINKIINMNSNEFKTKLDSREFWGDNSKEMWDAAYAWIEEANSDENLCKWSWDCGLKLDYDGEICKISSRFYPPHKSSDEYGKYHGSISVYIGDVKIHNHDIEASSLDDLKTIVEEYTAKIIERITANIKAAFS